jgi:hypothetical protein
MDLTGLGSVADLAKGLVDRFLPAKMTGAEKAQAQIQLQEVLDKRETALVESQKSIIMSEMSQGDTFTKRARPCIVYFGLIAIGLVHVILPITAWLVLITTGKPLTDMPSIMLPGKFWGTWGGVCSIWVIGRSAEKRGSANKLVSMITGGRK